MTSLLPARMLVAAVLAAGLAGAAPMPASACVAEHPCAVDAGSYIARPPPGWDGSSPLPLALFFHGWQGSAAGVLKNKALTGRFADRGILLVIPDGLNRTWSFPGSPSRHRDEFAFVAQVLDDVARRYPIDRTRVWASGFSLGGSMVWSLACAMGDRFTAFAPIAGAFWDPVPADCPSGPQNIRHIHGLTDPTVPLEGRRIRDIFKQSDLFDSFETFKRVNGCRSQPDRFSTEGRLVCRIWESCGSGAQLQMCLHDGGHSIRTEWLDGAARFADERAGSTAAAR